MECSTRCIACTKSQIYKVKGNCHGTCEYHSRSGSIKCNICSYIINLSDLEIIDKEVQGFGTVKSICSMHNIEFRDYCTVCQNESLEAVNTLRKSSTFHEMPHQCVNTVCREIEASNINLANPNNPSDENLCNYCSKAGILRKFPCTHVICEICLLESQLCKLCQLQGSLSYHILTGRQPQPRIYYTNNISLNNEQDIIDRRISEENKTDSDNRRSHHLESDEESVASDVEIIPSDEESVASYVEIIASDEMIIASDPENISPKNNKIITPEVDANIERYKLNSKPKSGSTSNPEENSNEPSPKKSSNKKNCSTNCCCSIL